MTDRQIDVQACSKAKRYADREQRDRTTDRKTDKMDTKTER